jgi:glycosyltransferase involved in cell wall biosynthesis
MPNGQPWSRLSIVTPSYNQGQFIEETIRSILLQGYPNLEYIIIDGGSTDSSVGIIRRYEPWLAYWVSEPDRGQSHAINKGFQKASGSILAYLNSDDIYYPGSFAFAIPALVHAGRDILVGAVDVVDLSQGQVNFKEHLSPNTGTSIHFFPIFQNGRRETLRFLQPGTFWRSTVWQQMGGMDERYHYIMDREWFIRALALGATVLIAEQSLARFSLHSGSKTQEHSLGDELVRAQIAWRLRTAPGFRYLPCLLESLHWYLRYSQDIFYTHYQQLHERGQNVLAFVTLFGVRVLRRLRMMLDALAVMDKNRHSSSTVE